MSNQNQASAANIQHVAQLQELQAQRAFFGDRAVNLAADLAVAQANTQALESRNAELEKELSELRLSMAT